jgi:ABC-type uncharacterized transport system substrate-binding protein
MRRRSFIAGLASAAAWPLAARAQQPVLPEIGFLNPGSPDTNTDNLRTFRQSPKDTGYVDGENVSIVYRFGDNQTDRIPALAAELVRRRVTVIVTTGGTAAHFAAKTATARIPIVFNVNQDPVGLGLVVSLARPGGNATGVNFFAGEMVAKRLGLLRELVPTALRVAVLVNPANPGPTVFLIAAGARRCVRHRAANPCPQRQHERRDRCGLCRPCARAPRCPLRLARLVLFQPPRANCHLGGAREDSDGLFGP